MTLNPTQDGIKNASDVALSVPSDGHTLTYEAATDKWRNFSLSGRAALATNGGEETLVTASSGAAYTVNLANGNVFNITLTANTTFTFSGATAAKACSFTLYKRQNGTGGRTVVWPASVRWSGVAPTLSTAANTIDIFVFESLDGGTTWFGSVVGTNFV